MSRKAKKVSLSPTGEDIAPVGMDESNIPTLEPSNEEKEAAAASLEALEEAEYESHTVSRLCFSGRVKVAVRVRPVLPHDVVASSTLNASTTATASAAAACIAVFPSSNTNANTKIQTIDAIRAWNASRKAQTESIGGGHRMILRLIKPAVSRGLGLEKAITHSNAGTAAGWWAAASSAHVSRVAEAQQQKTLDGGASIKDFEFPFLFGPAASQETVYQELEVDRLVEEAVGGGAATVMCFGQTGSGKTFTMSGDQGELKELERTPGEHQTAATSSPEHQGLQYKAIQYLMEVMLPKLSQAGYHVSIQASYVEVHNEKVNDLLQGKENLKVRFHRSSQRFFLEGLLLVTCEDIEDAWLVLEQAQKERHRAAHRLNRDSSRSHTIFTVYIEVNRSGESKNGGTLDSAEGDRRLGFDDEDDEEVLGGGSGKAAAVNRSTTRGKLSFVDLAGSERLRETESKDDKAVQAINRSLFALGSVIEKLSALSRSGAGGMPAAAPQDSFIPYRSSVLTQLLMDSLSGNGELLFITCVSPCLRFAEESLQSLYYAQRCGDIERKRKNQQDIARASLLTHSGNHTEALARLSARVEQLEKALDISQQENRMFRQALGLSMKGRVSEKLIYSQLAGVPTLRRPGMLPPPPPASGSQCVGEEEVPGTVEFTSLPPRALSSMRKPPAAALVASTTKNPQPAMCFSSEPRQAPATRMSKLTPMFPRETTRKRSSKQHSAGHALAPPPPPLTSRQERKEEKLSSSLLLLQKPTLSTSNTNFRHRTASADAVSGMTAGTLGSSNSAGLSSSNLLSRSVLRSSACPPNGQSTFDLSVFSPPVAREVEEASARPSADGPQESSPVSPSPFLVRDAGKVGGSLSPPVPRCALDILNALPDL